MPTSGFLRRLSAQVESVPLLDPVASVREHLRVLLNTRQGSCESDPSYGLPDLTEVTHRFPEGIGTLLQLIRVSIERHEPRLSSVVVRRDSLSAEALTLRFEIEARLASGEPVCFHTQLRRAARLELD